MRKCLSVLLVFLTLGCKSTIDNGYRLPPETMAKMLSDIHIAEAYSTIVKKDTTLRGFDKNMDSLATYYKEIFAHYHITQKQFDESLEWYKRHSDDMDSMYQKIIPELSKYNK